MSLTFDSMYSYLMDVTWFFLGTWVVLLTTASIVAFSSDWPQTTGKATK
jgi:hypothetical protein